MEKSIRHIEHLISPYLDGELNEVMRQTFESHVEKCAQCRRVFREQQRAQELISNAAAQNQHLSTKLILAYHDGRISPEQHKLVEHHLQACETCRKILDAAKALEEVEPNQSIAKPAAVHPAKRTAKGLLRGFLEKKRLIPAIAIMAIIILILILFMPRSNPYASLATITPAPYVAAGTRGEKEEAWILFETGMENYINKDYAAAEHVLGEAVRIEPQNPQFQFFYGVTLLLNQNCSEGLDHLTQTSVRQSSYREDALWYAAQAQLKLGKSEQAIKNLQELAQSNGSFSDSAKSLLNEVVAIQN